MYLQRHFHHLCHFFERRRLICKAFLRSFIIPLSLRQVRIFFPQVRSFSQIRLYLQDYEQVFFHPPIFRISLGKLENGHQMSPQGFTWVCHPVVASVVDTHHLLLHLSSTTIGCYVFSTSQLLGKIRLTHPLHSSPLFRIFRIVICLDAK